MVVGWIDKEVVEFIRQKQLGTTTLESRGVGIHHHHHPHLLYYPPLHTPRVFGLHPVSNGISRGLIEAGRQLYWGAGSLAWEQGVAGLRGIGPCLGVMQRVWHSHGVHSHTQCIRYKHQSVLAA